jgi:hypothetical protein
MSTLPAIDELWDFSDPAASAERFESLLDSDDESFVAEVRTQIARTQGLRGLFDEAHSTLDDVSVVLPRVGQRVEARYLLERGRVDRHGAHARDCGGAGSSDRMDDAGVPAGRGDATGAGTPLVRALGEQHRVDVSRPGGVFGRAEFL